MSEYGFELLPIKGANLFKEFIRYERAGKMGGLPVEPYFITK